jgi:hypothetical protein
LLSVICLEQARLGSTHEVADCKRRSRARGSARASGRRIFERQAFLAGSVVLAPREPLPGSRRQPLQHLPVGKPRLRFVHPGLRQAVRRRLRDGRASFAASAKAIRMSPDAVDHKNGKQYEFLHHRHRPQRVELARSPCFSRTVGPGASYR